MNEISRSESYAAAGVDITAGYRAVELMKQHIARTMTDVETSIGGFGGVFPLDLTGIQKPVLVSGTDGVGTKLKIAFGSASRTSSPAWRKAAFSPAAPSSAAKPPKCPGSIRKRNTTWRASAWAWWTGIR